jgi:hypothetical protein
VRQEGYGTGDVETWRSIEDELERAFLLSQDRYFILLSALSKSLRLLFSL